MSRVGRPALTAALIGLISVLFTAPAVADSVVLETARVSQASTGTGGTGESHYPVISQDGRTIVFSSSADNLVNGDTNGVPDIFTYRLATGNMTRVSVASDGTEANSSSFSNSVSADGTKIVFLSAASNLVPGDTNDIIDVFLHDTTTRETIRVSEADDGTEANLSSRDPYISADGGTIVYSSSAQTLVPGGTNGFRNIFRYDVATETTTRISMGHTGEESDEHSTYPTVTADGSTIVYTSFATNIVPDDTNGMLDIFAFDAATEATTRLSLGTNGQQLDHNSSDSMITPDGARVVFESTATNVVDVSSPWASDIYWIDMATGAVSRVSVASDGTPGNGASEAGHISADGTTVVFESDASNLVPGDTNGVRDVFVHEIGSATTTLVSVATDDTLGDDDSDWPAVSGDGTRIVYQSQATTLIDTDVNAEWDVFFTEILNRSPVVDDGTLMVDETTPVGGLVGQVPAIDPDKDDLNYAITGGDDTVFAVDTHGRVTTLVLLDYETQDTYSLTVSVDDGEFSGVSNLTIDVGNVNERPETFDIDSSVAEDAAIGVTIATVAATDPDDDPLGFAITRGPNALFAVDPDTGVVTTIGTLDHETGATHVLTVTVSDGQLATDATVTITVTDVNEVPQASGVTSQVAEDVATGTEIGTVVATDPENDVLTYAITEGDSGGRFAIDADGLVTVALPLDYETATSHMLTVSVSDGALSTTAEVAVDVTDIYEVDPAYDPYDDDTIFEADIEWLAYHEITRGCAPRLYCPNDLVTREQMAAFLSRALKLPMASEDYFTDDEDSIFEDNINRLAAAGITKGCNPGEANTRFCPGDPVTRGELAAFLVRALGYSDEGDGDIFADDDGSIFESAIDKLATAGVTRGCNPADGNTHFCPTDHVTRGQMAAFLHRALG